MSPPVGASQVMSASDPLSSEPVRSTTMFNGWPGVFLSVDPPVLILQLLPGFGNAPVQRVRKSYAVSEPNENAPLVYFGKPEPTVSLKSSWTLLRTGCLAQAIRSC